MLSQSILPQVIWNDGGYRLVQEMLDDGVLITLEYVSGFNAMNEPNWNKILDFALDEYEDESEPRKLRALKALVKWIIKNES